RVISAPADAARLGAVAAEPPLADGEAAVAEVFRRHPDTGAGTLDHAAEPLRERHRAADRDQRDDEGETRTQARHGGIVVQAASSDHAANRSKRPARKKAGPLSLRGQRNPPSSRVGLVWRSMRPARRRRAYSMPSARAIVWNKSVWLVTPTTLAACGPWA